MIKSNHHNKSVNPQFSLPERKLEPLSYYIDGVKKGDRFILSESITLLESSNQNKRFLGEQILDKFSGLKESIRIGITGSPGVGKSSFIEVFGEYLVTQGHMPAILAIDPSSQINKGSILGDKTRMEKLSTNKQAYIRPTPAGDVLGGTSFHTKEAIQLCEAAGFDVVIIETVGVGQSETEVDRVVDINLLLLQPGSGDEIQGIKRGIVENADIFIITKADGDQKKLAKSSKIAYSNAIQMFHHQVPNWQCPVILSSAINNDGMEEIFNQINKYIAFIKESNYFSDQRLAQEVEWFEKLAIQKINKMILSYKGISDSLASLKSSIQKNTLSPLSALRQVEVMMEDILHAKK